MGRKKSFGKRKFAGNQFKSPTGKSVADKENIVLLNNTSASSRKILINSDENTTKYSGNNIIIRMDILSELLRSSVSCKFCHNSDCMVAEEELSSHKGLSVSVRFKCTVCGNAASSMSSPRSKGVYDINMQLVYGMRCIGKGRNAAEILCSILNLPPPPTKFGAYHKQLMSSLQQISTQSMIDATEESVNLSNEGRDITAAFDGSWQKRGHTSLNGVTTATSLETGKVLDFECLSKYCSACNKHSNITDHECQKNYDGYSGGMESAGVIQIFKRSIDTRNVRYINYLGDGDSKAFDTVKSSNVYGENQVIEKLECIGHVQKRMGARLRNLKKTLVKKKLSDKKSISGRGRLTDAEVLLLQRYYGLAIRRNVGKSVSDMVQSIWAIYFHKLSTDDLPQHGLCPTDEDSWCGYHRSLNSGKEYHHKNSLPEAVMTAIKPVFRALTNVKLLEKCLHGKTQNPNESFNNCVWERLPKTTFHGLTNLKLGVMDAVICFNDGAQKRIDVITHLGIQPGYYMIAGLKKIDNRRICKANVVAKNASKAARKLKRAQKNKNNHIESSDKTEYGAGEF